MSFVNIQMSRKHIISDMIFFVGSNVQPIEIQQKILKLVLRAIMLKVLNDILCTMIKLRLIEEKNIVFTKRVLTFQKIFLSACQKIY